MDLPLVSFVIPAYDAAETLPATLSGLAGQTVAAFEAIVVDDGSRDGTAAIAEDWAARDGRYRLVRKANGGVSSARNAGLREARGRWVVFLDADDWLDDHFLERMLAALDAEPGSPIARCRHARVAPSGALVLGPENNPEPDTFFDTLARQALGAIHAYVTDTALVRAVGGFDERLKICEDWDLWQRIARTGARLVTIPDCLAFYRMQPGSLTSDGLRLLQDARVVLTRGQTVDFRVRNADPRYHAGVPRYPIEPALSAIAVWSATSALVAGKPWLPVLDAVRDWSNLPDHPKVVHAVLEGYLIGAGLAPRELEGATDRLEAVALEIFTEVARRAGRPAMVGNWRRGLGMALAARGMPCCGVRRLVVPRDGILPALPPAPGGEHLAVAIRIRRRYIGLADTVRWAAFRRADVLRLVAVGLGRRLFDRLRRPLVRRIAPPAGPWQGGLPWRMRRRAVSLIQRVGWAIENLEVQPSPMLFAVGAARAPAPALAVPVALPAPAVAAGGDWEKFFAAENPWKYDSDYERLKYRRTLSLLEGLTIGNALELACAEGHFTEILAGSVERLLATDISTRALGRARRRCEDLPNVDFRKLDFFQHQIPGTWDLIVCSEVLYYTSGEDQLAAVARKLSGALSPGGALLTAHAHQIADDPTRSGFDWEHPYRGRPILALLAEAGDLVPVKRVATPLYDVVLYRRRADVAPGTVEEVRTLPLGSALRPEVESGVVWGGALRSRAEARRIVGYDVPVLMYHRVTDNPHPGLARWAVSPAAFDRQMSFLRRRGFHTMSMREFLEAKRHGRRVAGRPVVISFDDAYVDFLENALPVLARKGFSATMFTPTGVIGGAADWDARFGPPAPIMDRAQLAEIAAAGIEIASHLHTHTRVDQLSYDALLHEATLSRQILAEFAGRPPDVVATPFGLADPASASVLRSAGYELIATTDHGFAGTASAGRLVPRLEVSSGALGFFHALLDRGGLEPPTEDELADEAADGGEAGRPAERALSA